MKIITLIALVFIFFCLQVRNVALGIVSRRINWEQLTIMETIDSKHTVLPFYLLRETRVEKGVRGGRMGSGFFIAV